MSGIRPRSMPAPPALAALDLAAHRQRAIRALALYFGHDLTRSPAEWEGRAEAVLRQLEIYGLAPVWLLDPAFGRTTACGARRMLGEGPGA